MPLEDKIKKFLNWLSEETEYGDWHDNVQNEVKTKLTEIMNEPDPKQHRWQFYMNGTFCADCNASIGEGSKPCR